MRILLETHRKILRIIQGPLTDAVTNEWRHRYNNQLEERKEIPSEVYKRQYINMGWTRVTEW